MVLKIIIVVALFASLWYITATLILSRALRMIANVKAGTSQGLSFSIVIAARNEETNIAACLESVLKQTISVDRYEVIVVDDRSCDKTAEIVSGFKQKNTHIQLLKVNEVPQGIVPKKYAISKGIACAKNEIIVFTDADCLVLPTWLETIDRYFTAEVGFLQGMTTYFYVPGMNRLFYGLQAVDFLSHGVVAASAIAAGIPINSNANNMAIRKQIFIQLGGYSNGMERIVSADDDLLLQKVWQSKQWNVMFMSDTAGAVTTKPTMSVGGVFDQRKRWGSNTAHYAPLQVIFLSGIFLFYSVIFLQIILAAFNPFYLYILIALTIIKFAGESVMMIPGTALFGRKELRKYLLPGSLIQLPVVLGAVIMGIFGTFSWKDQKFKRKLK